ncbi:MULTISPECIES: rhodanese-like domain-containing protein [Shewanella]|uniref:Rhodanese-like domain-containing protein n=1 Tax=Shewanella metallivivens TaxID=2872342 RepID=A0ABT5TKY3_9GAMM|nr:rhodanese-like domain-containing protein [Shewanella metallivivens]MDD8059276.1 rhodanese-like domain-containing protein [Shewanella metallivivens]
MQASPAFANLVESVMPHIRLLTIEQYQQQDQWQLIDVREDNEWLQGHLPKAKHLSRGIIERDIEQRFPDKTMPILLYCGAGQRAALAAYNLQIMGYTQVASMIGGYRAWIQHQFPIVQD